MQLQREEGKGSKHTFLEEKADLVARVEEVVVTDMIALLAGTELCHGMIVEGEVVEHGVSFFEQGLCRLWTQGIGDEEVAICVPKVELFLGQAAAGIGRGWWRDARRHYLCVDMRVEKVEVRVMFK